MTKESRLRAHIRAVLALGVFVVLISLVPPRFDHGRTFFTYLGVALVASIIKIKLPGLAGSLSPNIIPILVGISELTLTESVLIGCAASLTQCIWHAKKRPRPLQLSFNVAVTAIAVWCSYCPPHPASWMPAWRASRTLPWTMLPQEQGWALAACHHSQFRRCGD